MTTQSPSRTQMIDLRVRQVFFAALGILLVGYMFLGRGFAHLAVGPIYIGDIVLALGVVSVALVLLGDGRSAAFARLRHPHAVVILLAAFMLLGVARTVPYLPIYGINALRDAVLWGYGAFAIMIYVLANRATLEGGLRVYASIAPLFALWLPVSYWAWASFFAPHMSTSYPSADIPLLFFKAQDMAVHAVAALTFSVIALGIVRRARTLLIGFIVAVPLAWILFITSVQSRGALLAIVAAIGVTVLWVRRPERWAHAISAAVFVVVLTAAPGLLSGVGGVVAPGGSPSPGASMVASGGPTSSPATQASPGATSGPSPVPTGRTVTIEQVAENFASIFGATSNPVLAGTRSFRLDWWSKIVGYTVFGPYFWTGKGFGINLADADGFQPTLDHSLRAPHNSHVTTLARMGVPGFTLWVILQAAWVLSLLRAIRSHRRSGDDQLAMAGAWLLVYWVAMVVNASFDPYLEGPQGGIWFWVVFGAGLLVMTARSRPGTAMRIPLLGEAGWAFPIRWHAASARTHELPG